MVGTDGRGADDLEEVGDGPDQRAVRALQFGVAAVIVALVVGLLVYRAVDDDDGGSQQARTEAADRKGSGERVRGGQRTTTTADPAVPQLRWPAEVAFRPAALGRLRQGPEDVKDPPEPGVYLFSDFDGWHLWLVRGPGVESVHGTVTSNDEMATAVAEPKRSDGSVDVDDKQFRFDLPGDVAVSAVVFNPGFYARTLVFDLQGPNGPLRPDQVHLGWGRAAATSMPVVVEKRPST